MNKLDQYRIAVIREAQNLIAVRDCREDQSIQPSGAYFMEDISSRYEITCIKRVAGEVLDYIQNNVGDVKENRAMASVLKARHTTMRRN